ncbi:carbon storage regulator [Salsuginibacillus kocurii]|nr:carbon storage regulator [Salsuginibacillus kocurii]
MKLGIEVPRHVDIHRQEVYLSIQEENSAAASAEKNILELISKELEQ